MVETTTNETDVSTRWNLFTDGSFNTKGRYVNILLENECNLKLEVVIKLEFPTYKITKMDTKLS